MKAQPALGLALLLSASLSFSANADDWPFYRGPNHDGASAELIRTNWTADPPRRLWQVPLAKGLSSVSIGGGRVFTLVAQPDKSIEREYCVALNADTGVILWRSPALGIADYPFGGVGEDDGPRSTPSIDGTRVYVLTTYLQLHCLNVTNGSILWSRNLQTEYGATLIPWENAASPLIEGDLVLLNGNASTNRLMAFNKLTGVEAWKRHNVPMTQSSPIAATIAGVRQAIFFTQSGLVSVVPETGAQLWRYPISYSTSTAASPVVGEDAVYASAAYGTGGGAVRILTNSTGLTTNQLWRLTGTRQNHWATPVYESGFLYGIYGQSSPRLECIEMTTGAQKWFRSGFGYGSTLKANGHIVVLSEAGELVLVAPNTNQYTEVGRFQALVATNSSMPWLPVKCWNSPAISGGRFYVRSTTALAAIDVAGALSPLLSLSAAGVVDGRFQLRVTSQDGSSLSSNQLEKIDLFFATDFSAGSPGWIRWTNALVLTNGQVRLEDPVNGPRKFFRAETRP